MAEIILSGIVYFIFTIALQFIAFKTGINRRNNGFSFWTGYTPVICICCLGLIKKETYTYAGIIGYLIANEIGEKAGWQ